MKQPLIVCVSLLLLVGASTPLVAADKDDGLPLSKDALFGMDEPAPKPGVGPEAVVEKPALPESKDALFDLGPAQAPTPQAQGQTLPESKDALFGVMADQPLVQTAKEAKPQAEPRRFSGYFQTELAYKYANPERWTKTLGRLELNGQGRLQQGASWKLGARVDYNAVYDLTDDYQSQVRNDQRAEFMLREAYLDIPVGDWEWRLGRQHVVWGEVVGLFVADVVSAKDFREFYLPDFQVLRIPQWAARAEYFEGDFHAEAVWIPFPSYDLVGKPVNLANPGVGADFYPYPPVSGPFTILGEEKPGNQLSHGNLGVRINQLSNGWDWSGFFYTSMNSSATLYQFTPNVFTPRHDRIWQLGGTVTKDLGEFVLKAEAVYTDGRRFNLVVPDADGVVEQDTLDWLVGFDFNPSGDTRINTQFYQRYVFDHDANIIPDRAESFVTLLVNHKLTKAWETEVLLVHSLNRRDWMLRPKVTWDFLPNWKARFGLDIFGGPATGLFGQYDQQDRVYAEVRYDF